MFATATRLDFASAGAATASTARAALSTPPAPPSGIVDSSENATAPVVAHRRGLAHQEPGVGYLARNPCSTLEEAPSASVAVTRSVSGPFARLSEISTVKDPALACCMVT